MKIDEFPEFTLEVISCGTVAAAVYHRDLFFYSALFWIFNLCFIVRSAPVIFYPLFYSAPLYTHSFLLHLCTWINKETQNVLQTNLKWLQGQKTWQWEQKMTTGEVKNIYKETNSNNTELSEWDANNYKESEGTEKSVQSKAKWHTDTNWPQRYPNYYRHEMMSITITKLKQLQRDKD